MDEHISRLVKSLPFAHLTVAGQDALALVERLRAEGRGWPIVIGDDDALRRTCDQLALDDTGVDAILERGREIRHPEALFAAQAEEREDFLRMLAEDGEDLPEEDDDQVEVGDWPTETGASPGLAVAYDAVSRQPLPAAHVVLLPTQDGTEAPAYLNWGGWNACPAPELHVAALRSWKARYGAEVVGMSGHVISVRVQRRPTTQEEALELARELYAYCPDIVDQGVGTLSNLAAELMAHDWWFFWWD